MRIYPNQLEQHLKKRLDPLYLIIGEEPVQQKDSLLAIRQMASLKEFTGYERYEVQTQSQWSQFFEHLSSRSLFADKRVIEVRISSSILDTDAMQTLLSLIDDDIRDQILVLVLSKIEARVQKQESYIALQKKAIEIFVYPPLSAHFSKGVEERLRKAHLQLEKEALSVFLSYTEGSLLAVVHAIEKIKLHYPTSSLLTKTDLQKVLEDLAEFTPTHLLQASLQGNIERTLHILTRLKQKDTEPLLLLGALTKEIRALIQFQTQGTIEAGKMASFALDQKRLLFASCSKRLPLSELNSLLLNATQIDTMIKGLAPGNVWEALEKVYLRLAGLTRLEIVST